MKLWLKRHKDTEDKQAETNDVLAQVSTLVGRLSATLGELDKHLLPPTPNGHAATKEQE